MGHPSARSRVEGLAEIGDKDQPERVARSGMLAMCDP
jgi:hypothetical protein